MNLSAPHIPARYFALLFDYLENAGTRCRDALGAAQVRTLNDPHSRLTATQADCLLNETVRLTGRQDLGFELGKLIKLNSHDILGYAVISCPTLDHALRLVSRYYRLMLPLFTMRYVRHALYAELMFTPIIGMPQSTFDFYMEVVPVSMYCQLMAMTQNRLGSCDIYVSTAAPPHLERYRELRGARFHFSSGVQPGVRAVIGTSELDVSMAMTDLRALQQAEVRCKLLLQQMDQQGNWSEWVTMMLREAEDTQPTLDELAVILNVSERTLDRYLARNQVSFRALSLKIRNERACELLSSGRYAVSQIAYRLGYTDIANFSRWFKKMNGVTPTAYTAHQHAGAGSNHGGAK